MKKPGNRWARSDSKKAELLAQHLESVFQPIPFQIPPADEESIQESLETPYQLTSPMDCFIVKEIKNMIRYNLNPKIAPGFDIITGKLIKELPRKGLVMLTIIFNAVLRLGYFPVQ